MDESLRHINPNPVLKANIISRGLFWWCNPLLKKGYQKPLTETDLYNVCPEDSSEYLSNKLESEWIKQLRRQKRNEEPSLIRALFNTYGIQYILVGFIVLFEETIKVIQPLLLGGLIRYFTPSSQVSKTEAWIYALGVSLCAIVVAVTHHPYFFAVQRMGMQMRVACCSLMYKKCLRLSNFAMGETTGKIVNLMSNDVRRFDPAVTYLHFLWVGPLQAIAVLAIIWHELGPSVLAGFFVLLLLIPIQTFMGKLFAKLRQKTATHTDERMKVMTEIINGMRVIKMYCWEKLFADLLMKIRREEVRHIARVYFSNAGLLTFWSLGPWPFLGPILLLLVLLSHPVRADTIFMCYMYFSTMHRVLTHRIVAAVKALSEVKVSCQRIQKFLLLEDIDRVTPDQIPDVEPAARESVLELDKVTAKWKGSSSDTNTLENISLEAESGKLVAIIGPVGAGKSSLLMTALGELPVVEGKVNVRGQLAYVSQQPWVFSGSIRQNIVFGGVFDRDKYDKVIKVSALKKDIASMPDRDATLIGDRGVSLSGGQRARVSLARALYMDASIYLLDDPLSAVDFTVGRHIFERCIVEHLKDKTRILVTHQVQFLPRVDTIYIIKNGKINGRGTFDELSHSGVDFSELLKRPENEKPSLVISQNMTPNVDELVSNSEAISVMGSTVSLNSTVDDYQPEPVQLPEKEASASGTVGYKVYVEYFRAGTGIFKFILLVLFNIAAQLFYIGSDLWLSRWSNQEEDRYSKVEKYNQFLSEHNITDSSNSSIISGIIIPSIDRNFNIYIFTGIILAMFLFGLARALLFFRIAVDASQVLHNRMFARILRVPISFFDTNPVGRMMNRFSKDIGQMDDMLPETFYDFVQCFLLIVGIILVAEVVNPYVIIPTVPLVILFVLVRKYYLQSSRSIKRLESTAQSPVFSYLSATLQGIHTIRCMHMEEKFMEEFDAYQDKHSEAYFLLLATNRWLAVRLDWLCAMFVTAVTICSVLAADNMNAGLVGLSITYTVTLMGMFQWAVRQSAAVENQMVAVERVLEYSRLPEEAVLESKPDKKPPPSWPQNGCITAQHVCLQYSSEGPCVLTNLNFTIKGKEKIGIVGRTGAGKSSLITTLFRMVEPQGCLLIDDINIQDIGLHDLRSKISIIPQDPVLFTGSLRKNLDPFQQHTDDEMWTALNEVQLKDEINSVSDGLSAKVSEGGLNYSVGQRQLICLARAILGNSRILLIDEATANVDPITDKLIQQTLRTKFKDCTVLTIAHRLHTIMDSDRIMVLHMGEIVEFDHPYTLLSRDRRFLYEMAQQTGETEFGNLLDIARTAAKTSYNPPVLLNGCIPHSLKLVTDQDKLFCNSSSRSSDSDNVGPEYGLHDIEEVVKLTDNEVKYREDENRDGRASGGRRPAHPGSSAFDSKDAEDNLQQNLTQESASPLLDEGDEREPSDLDALLGSNVRSSSNLVEPSPSVILSDEDDKKDDDGAIDESQVLLKTGNSRNVGDNLKFDAKVDV